MPIDLTTTPFGRNVRRLRCERQWTLKELGDRAGYRDNYLSRIENGLITTAVDNGQLVRRLADAFGVTVAEVKGQPFDPGGDPSTDLIRLMLPRIRAALTGGPEALVGEPRPIGVLAREADMAMLLRMRGDYDALASLLPTLITDSWARTETGSAEDQVVAWGALHGAAFTACMTLRGLGWVDLAWNAARVAEDAARELGTPEHCAAAAWATAHTLLAQGSTKRAITITNRALNDLDGLDLTDAGRQIAGMHHLSGALIHAALQDGAAAADHLDHAAELAEHVDPTVSAFQLQFSRGNVRVHQLSTALELRDFGRVTELEPGFHAEQELAVEERVARWHIERTRAHAGLGQHDAAWDAAIEAHKAAPKHTPTRPVFRNVVSSLVLQGSRKTLHPARARLARTVGALAHA